MTSETRATPSGDSPKPSGDSPKPSGDSPKPHGDAFTATGSPPPVSAGSASAGTAPLKKAGDPFLKGDGDGKGGGEGGSVSARGNPAGYDQASVASPVGSEPGRADEVSAVLHPPGSTVPAAAHHSPGLKIEDAVASGLSDEDPAERPHGEDPDRMSRVPDGDPTARPNRS